MGEQRAFHVGGSDSVPGDNAWVPIPAYTAEWMAPIRAQASMLMMPSGTSGM